MTSGGAVDAAALHHGGAPKAEVSLAEVEGFSLHGSPDLDSGSPRLGGKTKGAARSIAGRGKARGAVASDAMTVECPGRGRPTDGTFKYRPDCSAHVAQ